MKALFLRTAAWWLTPVGVVATILAMLVHPGGVAVSVVFFILTFFLAVFAPTSTQRDGHVHNRGRFLGRTWSDVGQHRFWDHRDEPTDPVAATPNGATLTPDGWTLTLRRKGFMRITKMAFFHMLAQSVALTLPVALVALFLGQPSDNIFNTFILVLTASFSFTQGLWLMALAMSSVVSKSTVTCQGLTLNVKVMLGGRLDFHLANAGTKASLKEGIFGTKLVLSNNKEKTVELTGDLNALRWIAVQIDNVDESEAQLVPHDIRRLQDQTSG